MGENRRGGKPGKITTPGQATVSGIKGQGKVLVVEEPLRKEGEEGQ